MESRAGCLVPVTRPASETCSLVLEQAAQQLMVHTDFQAAFHTCERGLASLAEDKHEDSRHAELKAGFCIVGIQALAELDQWRDVFPWVLQHYGSPENMPAKIMQMCLLLHTKMGAEADMLQHSHCWLSCPSNAWPGGPGGQGGFGTVAELHLLCLLVPLGRLEEARALVLGEIGARAFTEEQRSAALDFVEEKEREAREGPADPGPGPDTGPSTESVEQAVSPQGALLPKLASALSALCRRLWHCGAGPSLRRACLALVLLLLLLARLDPAWPSSFLWINKLLQLLTQMWGAMFVFRK